MPGPNAKSELVRRWDGTKWPLAAGVLIVTMTLGAGHAYAAPPHHTPHHRRGARVHAANIICPSVRKIHWFDNLCGYGGGMGSPTAFGMGFNMEGWLPGQLGWLRPRLAPIGPRNLESLIGYLHGMVATKNRKAPYDWAKDAGGSKIKAAAATCLLAGVTAATAQSIFTWIVLAHGFNLAATRAVFVLEPCGSRAQLVRLLEPVGFTVTRIGCSTVYFRTRGS